MIFIFVLGVSYFYNRHSCLNHWIEFLQRPPNQCEEYLEDVISYLESMADSYTEESLNISAGVFEASHVWQSSSILRIWFQNNWLNQAKVYCIMIFVILYQKQSYRSLLS